MLKLNNYIFLLNLSFLISGCATRLTKEEENIQQIYSIESTCLKIGEIEVGNKWDSSFSDVKNKLKRATKEMGGNTFVIDKVVGGRRATAFVLICSKAKAPLKRKKILTT